MRKLFWRGAKVTLFLVGLAVVGVVAAALAMDHAVSFGVQSRGSGVAEPAPPAALAAMEADVAADAAWPYVRDVTLGTLTDRLDVGMDRFSPSAVAGRRELYGDRWRAVVAGRMVDAVEPIVREEWGRAARATWVPGTPRREVDVWGWLDRSSAELVRRIDDRRADLVRAIDAAAASVVPVPRDARPARRPALPAGLSTAALDRRQAEEDAAAEELARQGRDDLK